MAAGIIPKVIATLAWTLYLADIGPNETQVLLALIGAIASVVNMLMLGRARHERRQQQQFQRDAISNRGLVAMVPEQVVRDIEAAKSAPAPPPAPAPPAGDQAP